MRSFVFQCKGCYYIRLHYCIITRIEFVHLRMRIISLFYLHQLLISVPVKTQLT